MMPSIQQTGHKIMNPIQKNTLAKVSKATAAGSFVHLAEKTAKSLVAAGLIVGNPAVMNDAGEMAYRTTVAGDAACAPAAPAGEGAAATAPATPRTPITVSAVVENFDLPPIRRGRGSAGASRYPFETMPVRGAFFIPATDDRPNPAKSMAGTVTAANKRLEPKAFAVRAVTDGASFGHPGVAGAVVGRTA
jgi:hypothetical protein